MQYEVNSERWLSLEDFPNETWVDVKGYENLYLVSNYGRIKTYPKIVNTGIKHSKTRTIKERICKIEFKQGSSKYCRIQLYKDGKYKHFNIHNIVANAFLSKMRYKYCDNEKVDVSKLEINHIDENIQNNKVENLEWCTHLYNMRYGTRLERAVKKANETRRKRV